ncbi:MAG: hypothetical protein D6713_05465 [Deltaproteobacteria bacterium]|nr:MAG: hypothetical protein D6713_05465 [Deltaproteobacteria bacterium]
MKRLFPSHALIAVAAFLLVALASVHPPEAFGKVVRKSYPPEWSRGFTPGVYIAGKLGIFEPNDDEIGLAGFGTGAFTGGLIGFRFHPNVAIEGEVDYYESGVGSLDLLANPYIFNVRIIAPGVFVEPYLEGGVGIYFAELDFDLGGGFVETDSGVGVGFHLGGGVDIRLGPGLALGTEVRWFTAKPDFRDIAGNDPDIGGVVVNMFLKVSF